MNKIIITLLTATALTGCASLLPKGGPAPRLYTLNASQRAAQTETVTPVAVSLKIAKPQTAPGLDTERIALHKTANQLDYYADAKWATDTGSLIQAVMLERFETSRQVQAVSNDLVALKNDYTLFSDILDFQIDQKDGKSQAHMRLSAKLVNDTDDSIVRTLRYDEFVPVNDMELASIVAGFDQAQQVINDKLVTDIVAVLRRTVRPVIAAVKP